jgi:hypothetical protein
MCVGVHRVVGVTGLTGRSLASMEVNEVFFWFAVIVGGMIAPAVLAWGVVRLIRRRRNGRRHNGR